jgi:hypothetical protein
LADALAKSTGEHPDALFAMNNGLNLTYRKVIVDFAAEHRLPSMHAFTEATRDGALISYATDRPALFRYAAVLAGKILKGAEAAVCCGATSRRLLEMLRTLGAPWPNYSP